MSTTLGVPPLTVGEGRASPAVPWYLYAVVAASTSVIVGLIWDISWHRTIGRDTFWTPAHLAIYLGGIVAGSSSGWLVLRTTFAGTEAERAASVPFWGFRGPLGAWVCIWGAFAMVTSAPFDNWWHDAYGLDVKILSPPHAVLGLGIVSIQAGALLMTLAAQNRQGEAAPSRLKWMYVYAAGLLVTLKAVMTMEYNFTNQMHSGQFYQVAALVFPIVLVAAARASKLRWPATAAAAIYLAVLLLMMWGLPLFRAEPRLAPVYHPVTSMVPPHFPLLLVCPALALDLVMRRVGTGRDWHLSLLLGTTFVLVLLPVQWFFADFLLSPMARNPLFAAGQWDYNIKPGDWYYRFWALDGFRAGDWNRALFARKIGGAVVIAVALSRVGLWWGNWMARVRR